MAVSADEAHNLITSVIYFRALAEVNDGSWLSLRPERKNHVPSYEMVTERTSTSCGMGPLPNALQIGIIPISLLLL
jgi:hypothetical protein